MIRRLCIAALLAVSLRAQAVRPAEFEVASIRPVVMRTAADKAARDQVEITATGVTVRMASLSFLIQWAYDLKFYQVSGPEWLKSQFYEVQARAADGSSTKEMRAMTQALLAERFHLVAHTESKEQAVYALTAGKDSSKLKKSSGGASSLRVVNGGFVFTNTTMTEFAERLSDFVTADRPVVDKTGLSGTYDFQLESMALEMKRGDAPSIVTAVADLGMQLKASREPLELLVVDRCEKSPSEN